MQEQPSWHSQGTRKVGHQSVDGDHQIQGSNDPGGLYNIAAGSVDHIGAAAECLSGRAQLQAMKLDIRNPEEFLQVGCRQASPAIPVTALPDNADIQKRG